MQDFFYFYFLCATIQLPANILQGMTGVSLRMFQSSAYVFELPNMSVSRPIQVARCGAKQFLFCHKVMLPSWARATSLPRAFSCRRATGGRWSFLLPSSPRRHATGWNPSLPRPAPGLNRLRQQIFCTLSADLPAPADRKLDGT